MFNWKHLAIAAFVWPNVTLAAAADVQPAVDAFVAALNGTDPAPFVAVFAAEASIADTLGAFNWQGAGAPARYFAALQKEVAADGWAGLQLAPRGAQTEMDKGGHAYVALPLFVNYSVKGVKKQDQGIFTLTLTNAGKEWKITSATWTYTSPPG
jgi:hypothetical protein